MLSSRGRRGSYSCGYTSWSVLFALFFASLIPMVIQQIDHCNVGYRHHTQVNFLATNMIFLRCEPTSCTSRPDAQQILTKSILLERSPSAQDTLVSTKCWNYCENGHSPYRDTRRTLRGTEFSMMTTAATKKPKLLPFLYPCIDSREGETLEIGHEKRISDSTRCLETRTFGCTRFSSRLFSLHHHVALFALRRSRPWSFADAFSVPQSYDEHTQLPPPDINLIPAAPRQNYVWYFKNIDIVGGLPVGESITTGGLKISIPHATVGPVDKCLENVTLTFENITLRKKLVLDIQGCVVNCRFNFINIRSAPITRWRMFPADASTDGTESDVEDEKDFGIELNISGSHFVNSTVNISGVVGPVIGRRRSPPADSDGGAWYPPDGSIITNSELGPIVRSYFRMPYLRNAPLVWIKLGQQISTASPAPIIFVNNSIFAVENVLQVQYGPWRYLRPQLVEVAFHKHVGCDGVVVEIRNIHSLSQFVFELPTASAPPWYEDSSVDYLEIPSVEEDMTASTLYRRGPTFRQIGTLFSRSFTRSSKRRRGYNSNCRRYDGGPAIPPPLRGYNTVSSGSSATVSVLFPQKMEHFMNSLVSITSVKMKWHKSLYLSVINSFNLSASRRIAQADGDAGTGETDEALDSAINVNVHDSIVVDNFCGRQRDVFSSTFAAVRLDSSSFASSQEEEVRIPFSNNGFFIEGIEIRFVSFEYLLLSAFLADWTNIESLFPSDPSQWAKFPPEDKSIIPEFTSVTPTTINNAKLLDLIVNDNVFANATSALLVGVEMSLAGIAWKTRAPTSGFDATTSRNSTRQSMGLFVRDVNVASASADPLTVPELVDFRRPASHDHLSLGRLARRGKDEEAARHSSSFLLKYSGGVTNKKNRPHSPDSNVTDNSFYYVNDGAFHEELRSRVFDQTSHKVVLLDTASAASDVTTDNAYAAGTSLSLSIAGVVIHVQQGFTLDSTFIAFDSVRCTSRYSCLGVSMNFYAAAVRGVWSDSVLGGMPVGNAIYGEVPPSIHSEIVSVPNNASYPPQIELPPSVANCKFYISNVIVNGGLRRSVGVAVHIDQRTQINDTQIHVKNVATLKGSLVNYAMDDAGVRILVSGGSDVSKCLFNVSDVFTNNTATAVLVSVTYNATVEGSQFEVKCHPDVSFSANRADTFQQLSRSDSDGTGPQQYRNELSYVNRYMYGSSEDIHGAEVTDHLRQLGAWDEDTDGYYMYNHGQGQGYENLFVSKQYRYAVFLIGCRLRGFLSTKAAVGFNSDPIDAISPVNFSDNRVVVENIAVRGGGDSEVSAVLFGNGAPSLRDALYRLVPISEEPHPRYSNQSPVQRTFAVYSIVRLNEFKFLHSRVMGSLGGAGVVSWAIVGAPVSELAFNYQLADSENIAYGDVGIELSQNTVLVSDIEMLSSQAGVALKINWDRPNNAGAFTRNRFSIAGVRAKRIDSVVTCWLGGMFASGNWLVGSMLRTWSGPGLGSVTVVSDVLKDSHFHFSDVRHVAFEGVNSRGAGYWGLSYSISVESHVNSSYTLSNALVVVENIEPPPPAGALGETQFSLVNFFFRMQVATFSPYSPLDGCLFVNENITMIGITRDQSQSIRARAAHLPRVVMSAVVYGGFDEDPYKTIAMFVIRNSVFRHTNIRVERVYGGSAVQLIVPQLEGRFSWSNNTFECANIRVTSSAYGDVGYPLDNNVANGGAPPSSGPRSGALTFDVHTYAINIFIPDGIIISDSSFVLTRVAAFRYLNGFYFPKPADAGDGIAVVVNIGARSSCATADESCLWPRSTVIERTTFNISAIRADSIGVSLVVQQRNQIRDNCRIFVTDVHMNHTNARNAVRFTLLNAAALENTTVTVRHISFINGLPHLHPNANAAICFNFESAAVVTGCLLIISHVLVLTDPDAIKQGLATPFNVYLTNHYEGSQGEGVVAATVDELFNRTRSLLTTQGSFTYCATILNLAESAWFLGSTFLLHTVNMSIYQPRLLNATSFGLYLVLGRPGDQTARSASLRRALIGATDFVVDGSAVGFGAFGAEIRDCSFRFINLYSTLGTLRYNSAATRVVYITLQKHTAMSGTTLFVKNVHSSMATGDSTERSLYYSGEEGDQRAGGSEAVLIQLKCLSRFQVFDYQNNTFLIDAVTSLSPIANTPAVMFNISGFGYFINNTITIRNAANRQAIPRKSLPATFARYDLYTGFYDFPIRVYGPSAPSPTVILYVVPEPGIGHLSSRDSVTESLIFRNNTFSLANITAAQWVDTAKASLDISQPMWAWTRPSQLAVRILQVPLRVPNRVYDPAGDEANSYTEIIDLNLSLVSIRGGIEVDISRAANITTVVDSVSPAPFFLPETHKVPPIDEVFGVFSTKGDVDFGPSTLPGLFPHLPHSLFPIVLPWPKINPLSPNDADMYKDPLETLQPEIPLGFDALGRRDNLSKVRARINAHRAPVIIASTFRLSRTYVSNVDANSIVVLRRSTLLFDLLGEGNVRFITATDSEVTLSDIRALGSVAVDISFVGSGAALTLQRVEVVSNDGDDVLGPLSEYEKSVLHAMERDFIEKGNNSDNTHQLNLTEVDKVTRTAVTRRLQGVLRYVLTDYAKRYRASSLEGANVSRSGFLAASINKTILGRNSVFISSSFALGASMLVSRVSAPRIVATIATHQCLEPVAARTRGADRNVICKIEISNSVFDMSTMFVAVQTGGSSNLFSPLAFVSESVGRPPVLEPGNISLFYLPAVAIAGVFGEGTYITITENKIIGHRVPLIGENMQSYNMSNFCDESLPISSACLPDALSSIGLEDVKEHNVIFRPSAAATTIFDGDGSGEPFTVPLDLPPSVMTLSFFPASIPQVLFPFGAFHVNPYGLTKYSLEDYTIANTRYESAAHLPVLSGYALSFTSNTVGVEGEGWALGEHLKEKAEDRSRCTVYEAYAFPQPLPTETRKGGAAVDVEQICFANENRSAAPPVAALSVVDGAATPHGLKSLELWGNYLDPFGCRGGVQARLHHLTKKLMAVEALLNSDNEMPMNSTIVTIVQNVVGAVNLTSMTALMDPSLTMTKAKIDELLDGRALTTTPATLKEANRELSYVRRWACNLVVVLGNRLLTAEGMHPMTRSPINHKAESADPLDLSSYRATMASVFARYKGALLPCGVVVNGSESERWAYTLEPPLPRRSFTGGSALSPDEYYSALTLNVGKFDVVRCHETVGGSAVFSPYGGDSDGSGSSANASYGTSNYPLKEYTNRAELVLRGAVVKGILQRLTRGGQGSHGKAVFIHTAHGPIGTGGRHAVTSMDLFPASSVETCLAPQQRWRPITFTAAVTSSNSITQSLSLLGEGGKNRTLTRASPTHSTESTKTKTRQLPFTLAPIPALSTAAAKTTAVTGVVVSSVALAGASSGGGQLGVANALTRLASCNEVDGDDSLPILVHPLRFSLYATSGGDGLRGAYSASVLSNTIIIPVIIAVLVLVPLQLLTRAVKGGGDLNIVSKAEALVSMGWPSLLIMPYSTLAEGIGVGIVRSLRGGHGYTAAQDTLSVTVGVIGVGVLLAFSGAWVWVIVRLIPRKKTGLASTRSSSPSAVFSSSSSEQKRRTRDQINDCDYRGLLEMPLVGASDGEEGREGGRGGPLEAATSSSSPSHSSLLSSLRGLPLVDYLHPLWRWVPLSEDTLRHAVLEEKATPHKQKSKSERFENSGPSSLAVNTTIRLRKAELRPISDEDMERYGNAVGDKRVFYAEIASFGCSVVVGIAEGLPSSLCKPRAVVALLAAIAQCLLSVTTGVPAELFLQALLALCVVPLSITVAVRVFVDDGTGAGKTSSGAGLDADAVLSAADSAIAALSVVGNIVGIILMVIGLLRAAWEMFTTYRRAAAGARSRTRLAQFTRNEDGEEANSENLNDVAVELLPAASRDAATVEEAQGDAPTLIVSVSTHNRDEAEGSGNESPEDDERRARKDEKVVVSPRPMSPPPLSGSRTVQHIVKDEDNRQVEEAEDESATKDYIKGGRSRRGKEVEGAISVPSRSQGKGQGYVSAFPLGDLDFEAEQPRRSLSAAFAGSPFAITSDMSLSQSSSPSSELPPGFENFKGPRWQAEILFKLEEAERSAERRV